VFLAIIVVVLALTAGPSGKVRLVEFGSLDSNEIGDTLAGIFAPLAFIWIVVTVFLQSQELAEQRRELILTRDELRLSREALEKQVAASQAQAEIFKDEKLTRDQARTFSEFEAIVEQIVRVATSRGVVFAHWGFTKEIGSGDLEHKSHALISSPTDFRNIQDRVDLVRELAESINLAQSNALTLLKGGWTITESPSLANDFDYLRAMIESASSLESELSEADRYRAVSLNLDQLLLEIQVTQEHHEFKKIWDN
jgi:hypothetical protein